MRLDANGWGLILQLVSIFALPVNIFALPLYIFVVQVYILTQFVFWYTEIPASIYTGTMKDTNIYTGSTDIYIRTISTSIYIGSTSIYIGTVCILVPTYIYCASVHNSQYIINISR